MLYLKEKKQFMTSFDEILKKKKEAKDVTPIKQDKTDIDSEIKDIEAHLDKKQLPFFEAEKKEETIPEPPAQPLHPMLQKPFDQLTRKERHQLKKLMKKGELPLETKGATTEKRVFPYTIRSIVPPRKDNFEAYCVLKIIESILYCKYSLRIFSLKSRSIGGYCEIISSKLIIGNKS